MFGLKKLAVPAVLAISLLIASPSFAYTVERGDTMYKISRENGVSLNELVVMNPQIRNINLIYVGQTINTEAKAVQPVKAVSQAAPATKAVAASGEVDLLARIVSAEARGESYAGKVAVAKVVLNRVASGKFPNSIEGVIYQQGQFSPVTNGSLNRPADADSIRAAVAALASGGNANGSLFFYNPALSGHSWLDTRPTVEVIGNHTFKR